MCRDVPPRASERANDLSPTAIAPIQGLARPGEGPGLAKAPIKTRMVHPCHQTYRYAARSAPGRRGPAQRPRCLVAPANPQGQPQRRKSPSKLISAGLVKEVKAKANDPIWRRDEESGSVLCAQAYSPRAAKAIAVNDAPEPEDAGEESDALANRDQAAILSKLDAKDARPVESTEPGPAGPAAPRGGSKLARVIGLLERDRGATIEELIAATGWLAHTTRAALTGLRKRGYAVAIDRSDDKRGSFYRIQAGETGLVEGPAKAETARRKEQSRSEPQAHQAA